MAHLLQLPNAAQASRQLRTLLRREVDVKAVPVPKASAFVLAGMFRGDAGQPLGMVLADLPFAAHAGASFALIPSEAAEEAVKARSLGDNLRDCFLEVLNVASRLFVAPVGTRVTLREHFLSHTPDMTNALTAGASPATVACFQVEIDGYGEGLVALRLLEA